MNSRRKVSLILHDGWVGGTWAVVDHWSDIMFGGFVQPDCRLRFDLLNRDDTYLHLKKRGYKSITNYLPPFREYISLEVVAVQDRLLELTHTDIDTAADIVRRVLYEDKYPTNMKFCPASFWRKLGQKR